eukprot:316858_1
MSQFMLQNTPGSLDNHAEGCTEQSKLSLWLKQYAFNDDVTAAFHQNGVNSLDDLHLLDNAKDIKDFVNSLDIKAFITKKKLINAINELQNQTALKNQNNDDEEKIPQSLKSRKICWEAIDDKLRKKERVKIQSNKHKNVKIDKINEKDKDTFQTHECVGYFVYFEVAGDMIKESWDDAFIRGASATVGITLVTVIPILPALFGYCKYKCKKCESYKKKYNVESKKFNDKLSEIKKSETFILPKLKELQKQEQTLNSHSFELERFCDLNHKSRVVMVIGPTGFGKSLVCNRLLGNVQDIDDISELKQSTAEFQVAMTGNAESVTNKLEKKSKIVYMKDCNEQQTFILSVIDTPGAFDSTGNDNDYNNMMSHYFGACGGINVFVILFKFG